MRTVQLRDARATLSALVEEAAHGEPAVITQPVASHEPSSWGSKSGTACAGSHPSADCCFRAPLEEADLPPRDATPLRDAAL